MVAYKDLFVALEKYKIEYLVAGGFAVNFHQVNRATADLDLILHLKNDNVIRFNKMMKDLGYVPRVPVKADDFANKQIRKQWMEEKGMVVFSFIQPHNPLELIDIFVEEPSPYDELEKNKLVVEAFGAKIFVVGLEDLLALKKSAGRPKDLLDIELLRERHERE